MTTKIEAGEGEVQKTLEQHRAVLWQEYEGGPQIVAISTRYDILMTTGVHAQDLWEGQLAVEDCIPGRDRFPAVERTIPLARIGRLKSTGAAADAALRALVEITEAARNRRYPPSELDLFVAQIRREPRWSLVKFVLILIGVLLLATACTTETQPVYDCSGVDATARVEAVHERRTRDRSRRTQVARSRRGWRGEAAARCWAGGIDPRRGR